MGLDAHGLPGVSLYAWLSEEPCVQGTLSRVLCVDRGGPQGRLDLNRVGDAVEVGLSLARKRCVAAARLIVLGRDLVARSWSRPRVDRFRFEPERTLAWRVLVLMLDRFFEQRPEVKDSTDRRYVLRIVASRRRGSRRTACPLYEGHALPRCLGARKAAQHSKVLVSNGLSCWFALRQGRWGGSPGRVSNISTMNRHTASTRGTVRSASWPTR